MTNKVRVRFAPSPTGMLHIGGVRAALFNYLFAKHHGGVFVLRIEDTDRERFVEGAVDQITDSLQWLGIIPDEGYWNGNHMGTHGPYIQSQRLEQYQKAAHELVQQGHAYYSRITPLDFEKKKQVAIEAKIPFVYRFDMEPTTSDKSTKGLPIRLKIPEGKTPWSDLVYGQFDVDNATIDDFVILKADGYPTYNFANVIDDHAMNISHVIRGPEFLPSTAKHALLYDMFNWDRPDFVHVPVILGPDGKKKLSKRDGDVDVMAFAEQGFLPDALINFLALLGWNDGTEQEFFNIEELIEKFDVTRIQKSPARFDIERLRWMNGRSIREGLSIEQLVERLSDFVPKAWLSDREYFSRVVELDRERFKTLMDAKSLLEFFFVEPTYSADLLKKMPRIEDLIMWLEPAITVIEEGSDQHDQLEKQLRDLAESLKISPGKLFAALRVAVTGRTEAPGIFDTILTVGRDRSVERIRRFLSVARKSKI